MKTAFVFPGQGAQAVGMGAGFYDSKLCAEANAILGFDVVGIMRGGPVEKLQTTSVCQPALFLHSALVLEALGLSGAPVQADGYLGLSLGEYTALYAAGVLDFADTLRVLAARGRAMEEACRQSAGAMLSVLGLEDSQVEDICERARGGDVLQPANYNSPGQVVLSGAIPAIQRAATLVKEAGGRAIQLKVAGAFHSPLMQTAAAPLRQALAKVELRADTGQVISNVSARPLQRAELLETLVRQITAPVRWSQSIRFLAGEKGVGRFLELGCGKVLCGLIQRTVPGIEVAAAATPEELAKLHPGRC